VLLALTGYETALLVVAFAFIAFALVVALVVPRSRPGFPGRRLDVFILVCAAFFIAQLTAVLVLAEVGEADEAVAEESTPTETESTPTETEQTTTETEQTTTETEPSQAAGDPAAGKEVFLGESGCASCHTLADAQATGAIGPNLDAVKPSYDKVVSQVTNGGGGMPPFGDSLTEEQIQDVAAYVSSATQG
jgi:cytochrome c6